MKTSSLTQISMRAAARFFGQPILLVLVSIALLAGTTRAPAATVLTFTPSQTRTSIDFENLASGASASTIGWTGSEVANVTGTSPRQPTSSLGSRVIQVDSGTTRRVITSSAQTITPAFTTSETIYFQGSINRTTSASSGARVVLRNSANANLGGFGVVDALASNNVANPFGLMTANGTWYYSSEAVAANAWYEVRLVIDLNASDITLSVGHLFVRNVTAGEADFRLVEDLSNINMGYTTDLNATQFTYWRIESFRASAQVDNLIGGVGTFAIPEPTTVAFFTLATLLGCASKARRLFR